MFVFVQIKLLYFRHVRERVPGPFRTLHVKLQNLFRICYVISYLIKFLLPDTILIVSFNFLTLRFFFDGLIIVTQKFFLIDIFLLLTSNTPSTLSINITFLLAQS